MIAILAIVAGLVFWLQTPRLISVFPQPDAKTVSTGESLRMVFSTSMDPESVESHLSIHPEHPGMSTWQGNTYTFTPDQLWQNSMTYEVELTKGARSNGWLSLKIGQENRWSFTVEDPLLAYLYPADAPAQIYTINPLTGEQKQITNVSGEVLDFSVSSDGSILFFSLNLGSEGSAIYYLDRVSDELALLLECPDALCRVPHVSPNNDFLAYERTPLAQDEKTQVWIASLPIGLFSNDHGNGIRLSPRLVSDPQNQTQQPLWSPGGLLTYYDDTYALFIIQTAQGEEIHRFPSQTGEMGDWDASGESFLFPEFITNPKTSATLNELNPIPASHLMRYILKNDSPSDLTLKDNLEDSAPSFSPDGKYLVFARKYLDIPHWTPGRQMWLLLLDGAEAYPLTDEPQYNHYAFTWKPDSQQIAYVRFNQTVLTEPPEIWLTKLDGSGQQRLVRNGYAPQWIP
ncbi:MAG: PD40 domain-containing protein [Anaerolineales bacterium]|nr:PD40 domain-containing protein [Anaerolineales bacterium]